MCNVEVRKLEHQVQHLTEQQQRSEERRAKLKDENGQFVERLILFFYRYSFAHVFSFTV